MSRGVNMGSLTNSSANGRQGRGAHLQVDVGARSDIGRARTNNEDCYYVLLEPNLFVVSDGMGGHAKGELASKLAVETVVKHFQEGEGNPAAPFFGEARADLCDRTNRLASAVDLANRKICESAAKHPAQRGMGATVVAALVRDHMLSIVHVGDSRAYLLRAGALEQLTTDHSLVNEHLRLGLMTPQQAESSELQNMLTRAVGAREDLDIDAYEHLLLDGDSVLLCTDGLTRMVSHSEIAKTLMATEDAQVAADRLVELANAHGGKDNVTVVVVRIRFCGALGRFYRWVRRSMRLPDAALSLERNR